MSRRAKTLEVYSSTDYESHAGEMRMMSPSIADLPRKVRRANSSQVFARKATGSIAFLRTLLLHLLIALAVLTCGCAGRADQGPAIRKELEDQQFAQARKYAESAHQQQEKSIKDWPAPVLLDIVVCPMTIIGLPACPFWLYDDLSGGPEKRLASYTELYKESVSEELTRADQQSKAGDFRGARTLYQEVWMVPSYSELKVSSDQHLRAEDGVCSTSYQLDDQSHPTADTLHECKQASFDGGTASADIIASLARSCLDRGELTKCDELSIYLPSARQAEIKQARITAAQADLERSFDAAVQSCHSVYLQVESFGGVTLPEMDEPEARHNLATACLAVNDPELAPVMDAETAAAITNLEQRVARGEVDPMMARAQMRIDQVPLCPKPYFDCLFEYLQRAGLPRDQIYALGFCSEQEKGSQSVDQCVKDETLTHTRRRIQIQKFQQDIEHWQHWH